MERFVTPKKPGHSVNDLSQPECFAELSRALECDEDEDRFKELLGKVVKHKPVSIPDVPE